MSKGFAVSAVLVLLLASAAVADLTYQEQWFGPLSGTNNVLVFGGDGSAASNNVVTASVSQLGTDAVCHDTGYQNTTGSLIQSAGVIGMLGDGMLGVSQEGDALGWQLQVPKFGFQDQDLDTALHQDVIKVGGEGSALALQTFVGVQTQLSFTPYGGSANIQGIAANMYDAAGGGPHGGAMITGGTEIGVGQTSY